jgi:hypothetical protein
MIIWEKKLFSKARKQCLFFSQLNIEEKNQVKKIKNRHESTPINMIDL